MSVWDKYEKRMKAYGATKRENAKKRESRMLDSKLKDSLSYHEVLINGSNQSVAIVNSDNLNEKVMLSLPGEDFTCGELVEWADNHWLITEKDANNEIYTKVKLLQCNYLLRWVDEDDIIRSQWCVIEDGTKYLIGEYEDRDFIVTRGDTRISMTIGKNEHTVKFKRDFRFLVDDTDSEEKLAYLLTKPLRVGKTYNGDGVYSFVLQEVVTTDYDNIELGIADYYRHFPKGESDPDYESQIEPPIESHDDDGKDLWI